jgi:hypothetical protein
MLEVLNDISPFTQPQPTIPTAKIEFHANPPNPL